jgi:hypothetical protein
VKRLLYRHRTWCERAVDPLEVAARLEAAGLTDRMAARFRHRDVFSLAEEMYARAARDSETETAPAERQGPWALGAGERATRAHVAQVRAHRVRGALAAAGWFALALLPGAVCALTLAGLTLTGGRARLAVGAGGALTTVIALCVALRHGPLRTGHRARPATRAWICVLLGYALLGDGLLRAASESGGSGALRAFGHALHILRAPAGGSGTHGAVPPDAGPGASGAWHTPALQGADAAAHGAEAVAQRMDVVAHGADAAAGGADLAAHGADVLTPFAAAPVLALVLAVVPAACCARLFAAGAGRGVGRSRALAEFTAWARPLLYAVFALFLAALGALLTLSAALLHQDAGYAGAGALGALLMLARLLILHGFTRAPALLLGTAGGAELLALAAACAADLPGCAGPAALVETAVGTAGPGVVPAAACGAAALALLVHATRTLTRASAHPSEEPA